MSTPDIRMENHGSIWLMRAFTPNGEEWVNDMVAVEQHFGGAAVVEWRFAADIVKGAREFGLEVEVTQ